jgi:hypothetical protein
MDCTSDASRDIDSKIDVPVTPNTELTITLSSPADRPFVLRQQQPMLNVASFIFNQHA